MKYHVWGRWLVNAQVNGRDRFVDPQLTPLLVAESRAQGPDAQIHSQATRADKPPSSAPLSYFRVSQRILVFDFDAWQEGEMSHRRICAHTRFIPSLVYRRITSDGVKSKAIIKERACHRNRQQYGKRKSQTTFTHSSTHAKIG